MQRVCQRLANSGYSYDELWTYTVDLVGKNLGLITFVAAELQRARQLDGPTIDRVFDAWVED